MLEQLRLEQLHSAATLVHKVQPPTPQYQWPQLSTMLGCELWVKHENHTATGAFKVRGGITFMQWLRRNHPEASGIITATRGNHGQSQARAATAMGIESTIVVPTGNSVEKNQAMRSFGAQVIEHGADFDEAKQHAEALSKQDSQFLVPPFHYAIVQGVASYALELFGHVADIDTVYVPIGCGSGICGLIAARDALGLKTDIVGVVSTQAQAAKLSFESGRLCSTESANTFADGVAVRQAVEESFNIYRNGAARIVAVDDDEIANAIRTYYLATHNVAEGAGAAPLAAAMQERHKNMHKRIAVILCGGNIDTEAFRHILAGGTPSA